MKDEQRERTLQRRSDDEALTDAEKLLRRLADETGGAYWKIGNATHLQEVYERIDHLETSEIKTTILYHSESSPLFQYLASAAFLLRRAVGGLRSTWLRVAEEVSR